MIAKIKTRADFRGIVNYANDQKNKKKSATLLAHEGVCAINNKTIADSFQIQTSMRPKVKSPVKHVSLAFSPQDTVRFPNDEKGNTTYGGDCQEMDGANGDSQYPIYHNQAS